MKREIGAVGATCDNCGNTLDSEIRPDGGVLVRSCNCATEQDELVELVIEPSPLETQNARSGDDFLDDPEEDD